MYCINTWRILMVQYGKTQKEYKTKYEILKNGKLWIEKILTNRGQYPLGELRMGKKQIELFKKYKPLMMQLVIKDI